MNGEAWFLELVVLLLVDLVLLELLREDCEEPFALVVLGTDVPLDVGGGLLGWLVTVIDLETTVWFILKSVIVSFKVYVPLWRKANVFERL